MNGLVRLFQKGRQDAELRKELSFHLENQIRRYIQEGMSEGEARRKARLEFGGVEQISEACREARGTLWLESIIQDVRYAVRTMWQSPGFTVAAVITLALGMGANTAMFTLIDAVLLRSLPVKNPASLYFLKYAGAKGVGISPPYPCFERFKSQAKSIAEIAAYTVYDKANIKVDRRLEQVAGARTSGNYYSTLGLSPVAGRLLTPADEKLDPPVAVISYEYWQRRFGGTPNTIGKTFVLDRRTFTIVGVAPRNFFGLQPGRKDDLTIPITTIGLLLPDGPAMLADPTSPWFESIARLKAGVSPEQARAESGAIFHAFLNDFPESADARRDYFNHIEMISASRGLEDLREHLSRPLGALTVVVALVLLIACANITNLLLARASNREREFAIRMAIGAGRVRLCRQLFVETGMLFLTGSALGILIAWWVTRVLCAFIAAGSRPILLELHWDWRALSFTAVLTLLVTIFFGTAPILRAMRTDPHTAMKDGMRTSAARSRVELGRCLIAFQIALSLILLVGASLFLRTLRNLETLDPGFRFDHTIEMKIQLAEDANGQAATRIAAWDRILSSVRQLPGVQAAGLSAMTPLDRSARRVGFHAPGFEARSDEDTFIGLNTVSEGYFEALETPLVRGRYFTQNDRSGTPTVAILNESAARHFFVERDPIGTTININDRRYTIIGVARDTKQANLRQEAGRCMYIPVRQPYDQGFQMTLSVRAVSDSQPIIAAAQKVVSRAEPDILVTDAHTLQQQVDESLLQEHLTSALAGAFGVLALVLSSVGLYGVMAYSVARRTSEIGIRMALGAMPNQVSWNILRQTFWLVAVGLAVGIPASMLLAGKAGPLLFGVTPRDILAQASAAGVLTVVAVVASYLPARRASRVDPMIALRFE
jgi:predicted permease